MLENYKEVVEALEDTNESAIAHRTNETFRVLTAISVIVLPLTLVASIWGMNVGVPGEADTTAFWASTGPATSSSAPAPPISRAAASPSTPNGTSSAMGTTASTK